MSEDVWDERALDGSEIAKELKVTRQAISNVLKRAMEKFYIKTKQLDTSWDPFEVSCAMLRMLGVANNTEDIKKFYNLFPPQIRNEIEACALEKHCSARTKERIKRNAV